MDDKPRDAGMPSMLPSRRHPRGGILKAVELRNGFVCNGGCVPPINPLQVRENLSADVMLADVKCGICFAPNAADGAVRMVDHIALSIRRLPEGVYLATSEDVPGLTVEGETREETEAAARLVVIELLEEEIGRPLPRSPHFTITYS